MSIVASGNSESSLSIASSKEISPDFVGSGSLSLLSSNNSSSGTKSESNGSETGGLDNCISTTLSLNFSVPYFIPYQTAPRATARGNPNIIHSVVDSGEETSVPERRAGAIIVAKRVPIPETNNPK